jgi:acyl-coenzyme A synthetase/AMP-(fatty) acid ligase
MSNVSQEGVRVEVRTLVGALAHHAGATPSQPAYVDELGSIAYGELWAATQRRAAWLAAQGVRSGEVVALAFDANLAGARRDLELLYAVAYLGAVALPLFPDVPQAVCEALIERQRAHWLLAAGAPPQVGSARSIDTRGYDLPQTPAPAARADAPEGGVFYAFTSGTTGAPKPLLFTHEQIFGNVRASALGIGTDASDRHMSPIPWASTVDLRYLLRAHAVGAAYVAAPFPENRAALCMLLERFGVTRMVASPWQARRLLQSPPPPRPLPPLRSLLIVGAFFSGAEIEAVRAALTPNLYVSYGVNEMGTICLLLPGEAAQAGNVGKPLPGVEARADDVKGHALPAGQAGELGFRAVWMCTGYAGNPEATRAHFRDGWFYPGDIGCVEPDGSIALRGRQGDVINYGGLKIWPEDIEAVLKRHPDLADAAVVGLPDPMAGQVPVAFVVARRPLSPQGVRGFCTAHIEATRIPPHFTVLDAIPRNAGGKVLREFLASHYVITPEGVRPRA